MFADPSPFPEDPDPLRAKLIDTIVLLERQNSVLVSLMLERDGLAAERDHFKVAYEEAEAERRRLDEVLQQLRRAQSGPKSERLDPDQFQLALENLEQDLAATAAAREEAAACNPEEARRKRRAPAKRLLGHLPRHLEREEIRIEPADTTCPCCGGAMPEIAAETTERLHVIPMKLCVRATVRPKYGCRACAEAVVQAPAPDCAVPGGLPTEALLAHIAVAKFQDGLPLYRQCQIFARDGVTLDRQTLADWCGRTAWWLKPLWELLVSSVLASPKLFVDDTRLPVLTKGGRTPKIGALGGLGRDDAP
jgi:transposase